MSRESDVGGPVSVSNGDVEVEKSFVADEFPVPAIKFRITSASEESEHVRIVDQIPEEFPMEGVGFHPDFENENWAAYKDHRVEYERTLEPNETVETVYGIRLDQLSEAEAFIVEPVLERPPVPDADAEGSREEGVEDILGEDRSQLVRDALQGNGSLADEAADELAAEAAAEEALDTEADEGADPLAADAADDPSPEEAVAVESGASPADVEAAFDDREGAAPPRQFSDEATPAVTRSPSGADADADPVESGDSAAAADATVDADAAVDAEATADATEPNDAVGAGASDVDADAPGDGADATALAVGAETATDEGAETDAETGSDPDDYVDLESSVDDGDAAADPSPADSGSLASTLAAELRAGDVDDDDLELLRSELDLGIPRSADVRIRRLQSQMDDLQAYSDALAEFIDEEGTGQELVDDIRSDVESLAAELETLGDELGTLDAAVTAADAERDDLRGDVDTLEGDLDALDERVEDAGQRLSDVDETANEALSGVEELNATLDEELETVHEDVDELSEDLSQTASAAAGLDEELGDVREDIAELDGDLVSARESLEADIGEIRSDLEELDDVKTRVESLEGDIEVLMQFRDRLNDAFGPGE